MIRTLLLILICTPLPLLAAPRVVATITPVHSLVAGVMQGVTEPQLLINGNRSPHSYQLKPSQRRALGQADLIVWVGESIESFLPKTLAALDPQRQIELAELTAIKRLPARNGGAWSHSEEETHQHHAHDIDGHLWLDPMNAKQIVAAVAARLSELDTGNADVYRTNAQALQQRLDALDNELTQQLTPLRQHPYLVFHDAYQYFEARYGLHPLGAISIDPEHKPGARRLTEIRRTIEQQQVRCLFHEPQFPASMAQVVSEGYQVQTAALDPTGATLPAGAEAYFTLLRNLSSQLVGCLAH